MTSSTRLSNTPHNRETYTRQIAFIAAFILPMGKFLEAPSILANYAKGDILIPAIIHFLLQSLILLGVLYALSQSKYTLMERLQKVFGKGIAVWFILYAIFFLIAAVLPVLDLEKFVYAAFFDTSPTTFSFGVFFFLSAFICAKGLKSIGRCGDLCLFLFLLPFVALIGMSLFTADFSHLLPFFGVDFKDVSQGIVRTTPHFSDIVLLLPLLVNHRYEKGDGAKIMSGYWVGSFFSLLLFAVFFGVYSSIAARQHYAFSKIAQHFPALDVVGRIDLIFVYLLSVVLLFYTCLPLTYTTELTALLFDTNRKTFFSAILSFLFFLFALFLNRHYDFFYELISVRLSPIFYLVADILPLFLIFLPKNLSQKTALQNTKTTKQKEAKIA